MKMRKNAHITIDKSLLQTFHKGEKRAHEKFGNSVFQ